MGKKLHITNVVIMSFVTLVALLFFATALFSIRFLPANVELTLTSSTIGTFIYMASVIVYFVLLIISFRKCNIYNKWFTWAAIINIIWFVLLVSFFVAMWILGQYAESLVTDMDQAMKLLGYLLIITMVINYTMIIGYAASFIVFIIGFFKNKLQPGEEYAEQPQKPLLIAQQ